MSDEADLHPDDAKALDPLLHLAESDREPQVRLAALRAAARFPLDHGLWMRVAHAVWRVAQSAPSGDPLRGEALAFAAGLPLRSLRERLREMSEDPREPAHEAIARALDEVADPGRIRALLGDRPDHECNYRLLAAMPLEDAGVRAEALPPPREHDNAFSNRFWWALCRARVGDFDPIDACFAPGVAPDDLFWGSPWSAYAEIARVRPIPQPMRRHLLRALEALEAMGDDGGLGHDLARALRLTVWAATGIADAEGNPPEPARAPQPVTLAPEFDLPESSRTLVERQLQDPQPRFDDGQIGWMIAREPARHFIPGLLALDHPGRDTATRLRLLRLIGLAADAQAGLAASPWRGAGAGGGAFAVERPTLIDDLPRAAARGRPLAGEPQLTTRSRGLRTMTTIGAPGPAAAGASPPPSPELARAEPSEAADAAETRTVNALLMHAGVPRPCFIAGVRNSVHCWIGPKQAGIAHADAPIPHIDLPPEGLELRVELCWTGRRDGQPDRHGSGPAASLRLPADRSAPSQACELAIDVPADIDTLEAHLMFTYRGKVFEAVRLSAEVRASDAVDQTVAPLRIEVEFGQREVIQLVDRTPVDATLVFGPAHLRLFGGHGGQIYDLASFDPLMAFLNDELFLNDTELVRRRERLGVAEGEALLDDSDPLVLGFFRDLARHGAALYQTLRRQKFTDPGDRIQVINLDPERHVPLEFIYDRATPSRNARLCAGWQSALTGDGSRCPACDQAAAAAQAQGAASWSDTICPLGFWAVRKVIERFDAARLGDLSLPTGPRRALRPLDAALCASTHFVAERERNALRAALTEHIAAPTVVDDWDQWEQAVHGSPPLLILIAHHDLDAGLDYLEIGDENLEEERRWRFRPQLNEALINPATIDPGPIVLLLGCETGRRIAETGYGGLAGQFKDFHASLVLGTMAKILGRHAAPLAAELVAELSSIDTPDADFGTLLRRIRRRLLAHGILMAFALVAIGDAEWRLPARATATPPLPPQG